MRVPVLSVHMNDICPNASIDCRFFTRIFFFANFFAVIIKKMVKIPRRLSGLLATRIPITIKKQEYKLQYITNQERKKKNTPKTREIFVIIIIKHSSSHYKGVFTFLIVAVIAAVYPRKDWSPICITIPLPDPSLHKVPKKQRFEDSRGFSLFEHSVVLNNDSNSPIIAELSTFI